MLLSTCDAGSATGERTISLSEQLKTTRTPPLGSSSFLEGSRNNCDHWQTTLDCCAHQQPSAKSVSGASADAHAHCKKCFSCPSLCLRRARHRVRSVPGTARPTSAGTCRRESLSFEDQDSLRHFEQWQVQNSSGKLWGSWAESKQRLKATDTWWRHTQLCGHKWCKARRIRCKSLPTLYSAGQLGDWVKLKAWRSCSASTMSSMFSMAEGGRPASGSQSFTSAEVYLEATEEPSPSSR